MPNFLSKLGGKVSDYYDQAKALVAPDPTLVPSLSSKLGNVNEYAQATQPQPVQQAPVSPMGMVVVPVSHPATDYGARPGERRLDLSQVGEPAEVASTAMRPLGRYASGTSRVPQTGPYVLEEGEAVVPAEENPGNVEGAPANFGGPVFPNDEHVKPQLDTDNPPPQKLSGGAEMDTEMAPLGGAKMDVSNPNQNQIETAGQDASAKTPHTMTGSTQMGGGAAQSVQEDKTKELAKQHAQIQQAKTEAADKGDLVGLGTALIQEREFNKSGPMQEVMKTAAMPSAFPAPEYTGPNAKGSKAPEPGKAIDPKIAAEDEFMYKMKTYNEGIQNARDKGTPEGDTEAGHLERAKLEFQKQHPWGSAGNHPGVLGRIGHALGEVGNVAGEALAPGITAAIPGSRLNRDIQDQQAQEDIKQGSAEQLQAAQTDKATQPTATKPQDQLAQNKLDAENSLKTIAQQLQNPSIAPEQRQALQQQQEQIYASNPEMKPKPEDQAKQPVGDEGVTQHQNALTTLTQAAGLTPEQDAAFKAAYGVKPTDSIATAEKHLGDAKAAAQLTSSERDRKLAKDIADRNHEDAKKEKKDAADTTRNDKSYQYQQTRLDKIRKPVDDTVTRFNRLKDTLAQNSPQADALVAPELLTAMAGGQGSGLRMNEAEISRIVGGRSHWEGLKAAVNKWSLDPASATSITTEQRKEIRALMDVAGKKLDKKQTAVTAASQELNAAASPEEHRKIVSGLQTKLDRVDNGKVQVQIPGYAPADINEDQLEAFRKKHPDATVEE